ncbi:MAG: hypothetical protein AAGJ96_00060 [Pseudomonadota bacterium]
MTDPPLLRLPDRARPADLAQLIPQLQALPAASDVWFDAGAITQMTFPIVHVVLSAQASRYGDAKVRITGADDIFFDAFSTLGLFSQMMKLEFAA